MGLDCILLSKRADPWLRWRHVAVCAAEMLKEEKIMKKMIWAGPPSTVTALGAAVGAQAQTSVPFALDWKFEGPSAAYFAAIDNGHFAAGGLDVEISAGSGSLDAIPKVATGAFPMGFTTSTR